MFCASDANNRINSDRIMGGLVSYMSADNAYGRVMIICGAACVQPAIATIISASNNQLSYYPRGTIVKTFSIYPANSIKIHFNH